VKMRENDRVAQILGQWASVRPDLDVSPIGVIGRLHRVGLRLTESLTAIYAEYGLTEGDFDVLATLRRSGTAAALTCGDLAASTMVTTGGMTKRIDRLEGAGLVRRQPSATDGRSRLVSLTPVGTDLIDEAYTAHVANEHTLVAPLSQEERDQLAQLLARWLAALEA